MRNFIVCTVRVIKSIRLRLAGHIARMKEGRSAFNSFTNKPYRKISLGRPRHRWEENIKKCLKEIQINTENWVDSAQDWGLLESPCECGTELPGSISHGVKNVSCPKVRY